MKLLTRFCLATFVAALVVLSLGSAQAQVWIGTVGDWQDPANWSTGVVPAANSTVNVENGGTAQISALTGNVPATGRLGTIFLRFSDSKIIQSGGSVAGTTAWLGGANGKGTYELQGGTLDLNSSTALDMAAFNTSGQQGYFIQSGGTATLGGVRMNFKGTGLADIQVSGGQMNVTNALSMSQGGGTGKQSSVTQSGGNVTISGQLQMGTGSALSGTSSAIVNLDGGVMTLANTTPITSVGGTNNFIDFDGGTLNLRGTWDFAGLTGIANSSFRVQGVAATADDLVFDPVTINSVAYTRVTLGTYRVGGSGATVDVQSQITGAANAVVVGGTAGLGGTVIFSNANTYTGNTQLNEGILRLGNAGALGTTSTILFGGGTLQFSSANTTDYSSRFSTAAGQAYSLDTNGEDVTLGTALSSSGGTLTKHGLGALTLSAANGQTDTTVNGGQLNVNHIAALGTPAGTLTMAAGTRLDNTSGGAVAVSNPKSIALGNSLTFVGTNDLGLGGGTTTLSAETTFDIQAGELAFGGDVVGAGFGIIKNGAGTLALGGLTGTNSFTGNSTINAGKLLLEGTSVLGGGSSTVVTLGENGFLEVGASASLGNVTIAGYTQNLITNTPVDANQDFTVSQTLSTANTKFNGVQTIGSGVTVTTSHNYLGTIPTSATPGRIVFENGATLAATENFEIDPNQGVALDAGTAIVSVGAGKRVFFESVVAGSGGLRKIGAGNLRLTSSNSYQGGTVIEQGIIGISLGAALGDVSSSLTIDGAILAAATYPDGSGTGATIDAARTVLIGNGKTSGLHAQTDLTLRYDGAIAEVDALGAAGSLQFGLAGPGRAR